MMMAGPQGRRFGRRFKPRLSTPLSLREHVPATLQKPYFTCISDKYRMKVMSAREAGCTLAHISRVETITAGKARW